LTVKSWNPGDVLTASDMNAWTVPRAAYKTVNETVTSSAVLQNDNELFITVDANAVYFVQLFMRYTAATAGDIQFGWTAPGGTTITNPYLHGFGTTAAVSTDDVIAAGLTAPGLGGIGSGTDVACNSVWIVTTAGTSGTLQLQWAQLASFATATTVVAGSVLIAARIG